ncbi:MAG TPA: tripartite tricarboxylate transporter substrate binding protein [Burkholderiales bacterium]|nr:tripartite tricarboxylate transporter substrate binding protein [Burkholderiales bacterium]
MKTVAIALFGLALAPALCAAAVADPVTNYPDKPVRLILPIAAGGGLDIVMRPLAQRLSASLRQPVVVDNRPGGGGTIGLATIVRAEPDGHTLGATSGSYATNAATYKLDYDPLGLTLISMIGESGYLVTLPPASPIKSINDLIATARANPGKLNYGSPGQGGSTHLATELFQLMSGVKMVQVPYKSTAAVITALFTGEIDIVFGATMPSVVPQLKNGRVRVIAITTLKRHSLLPDVPTVAESGVPGYEALVWYGFLGPRGIPGPIVTRLNRDMAAILKAPDVRERMAAEGLELPDTSPEYFRKVLRRDIEKWTRVVKAANIKVDQ